MAHIRIAVDGVVINQAMILLLEFDDPTLGHHFGLPGGGVEPNERLHEAMQREIREETGADVIVGPLLFVQENYAEQELRLIFHCAWREETALVAPTIPEPGQIGVRWIPLAELADLHLLPTVNSLLLDLLAMPLLQNLLYQGE